MEVSRLLDLLPLWMLFLVTVTVVLLSIEFGFRLARHQLLRSAEAKDAAVGAMVGAILGLLAFMQAFTFGFAASRFEDKKQIVLAESTAIKTAYLRAALVPEPICTDSRRLLHEYVDVRLKGAQIGNTDEAILKSQELHARLWSQAVVAGEKGRPPVNSLFIQSINEVIDLHGKRITVGLRNRVAGVIWLALYSLLILAMATLGYQGGLSNNRRSVAVLTLVFAFSTVLILIVDLDRPGDGLLSVSQQSMIDVRDFMSGANMQH
jgi:hypothetical protein